MKEFSLKVKESSLDSKDFACSAADLGWILGLGRSPGEGHGSPLQYSCLENPMDREAWWATVHGVTKSMTEGLTLSLFTFSKENKDAIFFLSSHNSLNILHGPLRPRLRSCILDLRRNVRDPKTHKISRLPWWPSG